MGKPNIWYYNDAKRMIIRYPHLKNSNSKYAVLCRYAVDNAMTKISEKENGPDIIRCIEMILINGTHTAEGASQQLYVSKRTVERWVSNFVRMVAEESKFYSEEGDN